MLTKARQRVRLDRQTAVNCRVRIIYCPTAPDGDLYLLRSSVFNLRLGKRIDMQ